MITGRGCPIIGAAPSDSDDVVAGLCREDAMTSQPIAHALRTGIVGRGRKPEIAELGVQFVQKLSRFRQRCNWIERIEHSTLLSGSGHELSNSLRPVATASRGSDRVGLEAALLPDQTRKKLNRKPVRLRGRFDQQAYRSSRRGRRRRLWIRVVRAIELVRSGRHG